MDKPDSYKFSLTCNLPINNLITIQDKDNKVIPETMHYLIDGGTEGLNGQARVIAPY